MTFDAVKVDDCTCTQETTIKAVNCVTRAKAQGGRTWLVGCASYDTVVVGS